MHAFLFFDLALSIFNNGRGFSDFSSIYQSQRYHFKLEKSNFISLLNQSLAISANNIMENKTYSTRTVATDGDLQIINCQFIKCLSHKNRGTVHTENINVKVLSSTFINNTMKACSAMDIGSSKNTNINITQIIGNNAKRVGGMQIDGSKMGDIAQVISSNISSNKATKWIGGVRFIHTSAANILNLYFQNAAEKYGALFDFNGAPSQCQTKQSLFINNTGNDNTAGITAYRMLFRGKIEKCLFYKNNNGDLLVMSDYAEIGLVSCVFDKQKGQSIFALYDNIRITETNNTYNKQPTNLNIIN